MAATAVIEVGSVVTRKGDCRKGVVESFSTSCGHPMRWPYHNGLRDRRACEFKPRQYAHVRWGSYSQRWNGEQLNTPLTALPVSRLALVNEEE